MKKNNLLDALIYTVTLLLLFLICCYLPAKTNIFAFEKKAKLITVGKGETASQFVHKLKQQGLVSSEKLTLLFLKLNGTDKKLPVGTLKLKQGTATDIVRQLKTVKAEYYAVTIIPGKTVRENAQLNSLNYDKLIAALSKTENFPKDIAQKLPANAVSRAVFMLPETYHLESGSDLETAIVAEASKLWAKRLAGAVAELDAGKILQYGIMASIVEGEARVPEDRPVLASIFFKRLRLPMRLQSCATVVYCWKEKGIKKSRLSYADLKIDSPYNTYTHDGLPPAPINIPSAESWKAVIGHGDTEYLYFVADGTGKHLFSKSYSEHLQKQKGISR